MQIAPIHCHPLLNPLCLSGFTLIQECKEWLADRDLLVMFMLWKMNKAWRRSVWVQSIALWRRQGWVERCGGWVGGVVGWRAVWRPQGPQARSTEKSFSSVCKAGAGLQRNLLNIKRQPPAVFPLSFYSIIEDSRRSCDIIFLIYFCEGVIVA